MESYYCILFDNLPEEQLEGKRLGELFSIKRGDTPSTKFPEYFCKNDGIPWIAIKDLTSDKGKFIDRGEMNITQAGYDSCNTYIIPEDTILFSIRGTLGDLIINDQKLCFNQGLTSFLPLDGNYEKNYYWFLLQNHKNTLIKLGKGTTINQISLKDLREFSINLPPQSLIEKFNNYCEPFFQIQKTNEREIRELLKLQKYFIELTN